MTTRRDLLHTLPATGAAFAIAGQLLLEDSPAVAQPVPAQPLKHFPFTRVHGKCSSLLFVEQIHAYGRCRPTAICSSGLSWRSACSFSRPAGR